MERISSLEKEIDQSNGTRAMIAFLQFCWSGVKFTDGTFEEQMKNAVHAANAVKTAEIGCSKFVNIGTLEETFVERYLQTKTFPITSISQIMLFPN